jgi:shikimate kinase
MGCGKTTLGHRVARQLGWRFVDLDTRIEERTGLAISAIFERQGEPAFRDIEHDLLSIALAEATALPQSTILALGGGTFAQPRNITLLRSSSALVVWLETPIDELLARCVTKTHRPLFRDEASFRNLYAERLPFYQRADFSVSNTGDPQQVVASICSLCVPGTSSAHKGVNA